MTRPSGSNADEWHLFLCELLDNRATYPNGMTYVAVQIAEAIDSACASHNHVLTASKEMLSAYNLGMSSPYKMRTAAEHLQAAIAEAEKQA